MFASNVGTKRDGEDHHLTKSSRTDAKIFMKRKLFNENFVYMMMKP